MKTIFLTYNEGSPVEESTALRLQTIASIYDFKVELPMRAGLGYKTETEARIKRASYVIALPLKNPSKKMMTELNYALKLNKLTIIIYDKKVGKTLAINENNKNILETSFDFDRETPEMVIKKVMDFIHNHTMRKDTAKSSVKDNDVATFLVVALGIAAFAAMFDNKK